MSGSRPTALVTGASGGIGADLARELARSGHDLVLAARDVPRLAALAAELRPGGAGCTVIESDLARPGAAAALAAAVAARGLTVDVLINNAGFGDLGPFAELDPDKLDRMLLVNVVALSELTRAFLPGMIARGRGRVMLLASTAAFQPGPGMAAYCATKAYVLSLGEAVAHELRGTGVTLTTLCPGATRTGFARAARAEGNRLFSGRLPVMTSAEVARLGHQALMQGRPVAVTGFANRIAALSGRLAPHRISLPVTRALLGART